jgi:hypothetical protein
VTPALKKIYYFIQILEMVWILGHIKKKIALKFTALIEHSQLSDTHQRLGDRGWGYASTLSAFKTKLVGNSHFVLQIPSETFSPRACGKIGH